MLALRLLESEEVALLLSSYLSQHACWTLRHVARNILSDQTAPRVRCALAWRQELGQLFALLEVILSSQSFLRSQSLQGDSPLVSLQDIRNSLAVFPCKVHSDVRIGQVIAVAGELLVSRELKCGEPGIGQQSGDGDCRVQTLTELCARSIQFEAKLVRMTEEFACGRVPSHVLSTRRPSGRRLSRQSSVLLKKGDQLQQYNEHMKSYVKAKSLKMECEQWISIAHGADSARVLLEQLFALGSAVTLKRVVKILPSTWSTLRPVTPLPLESVPAALLLLISRTSGGLAVETVKKSGPQDRSCFLNFEGASSSRSKGALEKELIELRRRHRQFGLDVKHAFMAMMPGPDSIGNDQDEDCEAR